MPSARWATIQLLRQTLSLRTCWKGQGRDRSGWRKQCSASRLTGKVLQILKRFHGCPKAKSLPEISVSAQFITIPLHVVCFFLSNSCYNPVSLSCQMGRDTHSKNSLRSAWCNRDSDCRCCCPGYANQGKAHPSGACSPGASTISALFRDTVEEKLRMINRASTHSANLSRFLPNSVEKETQL